jgi:hypothetical protein
VHPHLQQVSAAALSALQSVNSAVEKRGMLKDIVKVFVREDVLASAELALTSKPDPCTAGLSTGAAASEETETGGFVDLSGDESSDDDSVQDVPLLKSTTTTSTTITSATTSASGLSRAFANGGLRMGSVRPLYGIRNRLKAELQSRANDNSASRLAVKVGVASSQDLTDVLGYAEAVRKMHAAVKADQQRVDRVKEEEEVQEKEARRRQYRERLQAAEDGDSEGEFDENEEGAARPVLEGWADFESEGDVASDSDDLDDDNAEDEMDEDAKLVALEIRERELAKEEEESSRKEATLASSTSAGSRSTGAPVAVEDGEAVVLEAAIREGGAAGRVRIADTDADAADTDANAASGSVLASSSLASGALEKHEASTEEDEEVEQKVHKPRNAKYIKMLQADSKKKNVPSSVAAFLDEEAEEEEEEGLQRGLLDFGFGKTSDKLDENDEADALKLRKSDVEGIVDELSDDEGDETEGARRRMEEERKSDRKLQMKILKNLAEGYGGRANLGQNGRGHYGMDELTKGGMLNKDAPVADEDQVDDKDEDANFEDDEVLQGKFLSSFTDRAKAKKHANLRAGEESDVSLSGVDSDEDEDEEEQDNGKLQTHHRAFFLSALLLGVKLLQSLCCV